MFYIMGTISAQNQQNPTGEKDHKLAGSRKTQREAPPKRSTIIMKKIKFKM